MPIKLDLNTNKSILRLLRLFVTMEKQGSSYAVLVKLVKGFMCKNSDKTFTGCSLRRYEFYNTTELWKDVTCPLCFEVLHET